MYINKKQIKKIALTVATIALGIMVNPANAAVKLCFSYYSTFTDAGVGEDYHTSSSATSRTARGMWVKVQQNGTTKFEEYLDLNGCTDSLSQLNTGPVSYTAYAASKVSNNNRVWINDDVSGTRGFHNGTKYITSTGTTNIAFVPNSSYRNQFDILAAASYAVYKNTGGKSDIRYRIRSNTTHSSGSHFRISGHNGNPTVYMWSGHSNKKFVIVHELGHALTYFNKGSRWENDCSFKSTSCPAAAGAHSMASKEHNSCAASEGFAHFYAAATYNNSSQDDCKVHYYKNEFGNDSSPIVDCETSNGAFVTKYVENSCVGNPTGYSTELDYMRAYWDVLTDGTNNPSVNDIVTWGSNANWGTSNATSRLNSTASGAISNKWPTARDNNGLN